MRHRRTYDTQFKFSARYNLLSRDMLLDIPKSTLHSFRNTDFDSIHGFEINSKMGKNISFFQESLNYQRFLDLCKAAFIVYKTLIRVLKLPKNSNPFLSKRIIISCIDRVKDTLGLPRALKYFKISKSTFQSWKSQLLSVCTLSPIKKCFRKIPNQLTITEVSRMKTLLLSPIYQYWPIASIAYHALHNNIVSAGLSTWYKYSKILGIHRFKIKKRKYTNGIRALFPKQILHADVTYFKLLDGTKVFIYLLMDNFSRKILSWKASLKLSGEFRRDSIKLGFSRFLQPTDNIRLIVDGGSENNNHLVSEYLFRPDVLIEKIIAQKDIPSSNSMIEAVNKILKYRWLYRKRYETLDSLVTDLDSIIPNYNARPHISLEGLTPDQAFNGEQIDKEQLKFQFQIAKRFRFSENKKMNCGKHS